MTAEEVSASEIGLESDEIKILLSGLLEWSGPARPTVEFITAMGFDPSAAFGEQIRTLRSALKNGDTLSPANWTRVVLATEVAFISDAVGSGVEWSTTTGWTDEETVVLLRSIQRKTAQIIHSTVGKEVGTTA